MVVLIANGLELAISDVFNTGCIKDEQNKLMLELLTTVLDNNIKEKFTDNEAKYLKEVLKNDIIELYNQFKLRPIVANNNVQFLAFIILDSYNTHKDLATKYDINLTVIVDKISDLTNIQASTIIFKKGDF